MSKDYLLVFCFIFILTAADAQSLFFKNIKGRVYSKDGDVAATHVKNVTTQRAAITDINGFFTISAKLNDTLLFSAVQFKKKQIVITTEVLNKSTLSVFLKDVLNQLDEVIVTPYNLTGDITKDLNILKIEPVVTTSTLGLPNAYVIPPTKAERELFEATTGGGFLPLNPILNGISGRTKMLKNRVKRNAKYARTQRVRAFYADSLIVSDLKIPELKIADFMYFCEVDSSFSSIVDTHDLLKIWEFMRKMSFIYRENNSLD